MEGRHIKRNTQNSVRRQRLLSGVKLRCYGVSPSLVLGERPGFALEWVGSRPHPVANPRSALPLGPDWAAVPGCPVARPAGLLTCHNICKGP